VPNPYACSVCAQPLVDGSAQPAVCGSCQLARPKFDASFIPYRYAYPVDRLIHRLKYHGDLSVGRVLGELFVERLRSERGSRLPEVIVPVPLATGRFRTRGFNQAIELAETIARSSGLAWQAGIVERTRETQEQAGLPRKQRRHNVRGAFELMRRPQHSHVAILDDVVTTGSTVNEIAKVLRRAGVEKIEVWAVARAARSA
jgi:ComF family protein